MSASLASIGKLLGGTNGIATKLANLVDGYTKPGGLLDTINKGLQTSLSSVADQQTALQAQLAAYSATAHRPIQCDGHRGGAAEANADLSQRRVQSRTPTRRSGTSQSNTSLGSGNLGVGG